jgi:hypothetical protein
MPSETDDRALKALEALAGPREAFHSALVATAEEVRGMLEARAGSDVERTTRTTAELGDFAAGRIDIERFGALAERRESLEEDDAAQVERAARTLESLIEREDDLFRARVEPDGDLRDTVESALSEAGRAFGAARSAELARSGRYRAEEHDAWIDHFPPGRWSRRERAVAPPLVVEVQGRDLKTGGLAEFMDGAQKIVLVVSGEAPPAALVRLITPSVFVMQVEGTEALGRLEGVPGPAVAAVVAAGASRFVHVPGANGRAPRLTVEYLPEEEPKQALGALSAFQQAEELRQLMAMAQVVTGSPPAPAAEGVGDATAGGEVGPPSAPADMLAAWILRQADLR